MEDQAAAATAAEPHPSSTSTSLDVSSSDFLSTVATESSPASASAAPGDSPSSPNFPSSSSSSSPVDDPPRSSSPPRSLSSSSSGTSVSYRQMGTRAPMAGRLLLGAAHSHHASIAARAEAHAQASPSARSHERASSASSSSSSSSRASAPSDFRPALSSPSIPSRYETLLYAGPPMERDGFNSRVSRFHAPTPGLMPAATFISSTPSTTGSTVGVGSYPLADQAAVPPLQQWHQTSCSQNGYGVGFASQANRFGAGGKSTSNARILIRPHPQAADSAPSSAASSFRARASSSTSSVRASSVFASSVPRVLPTAGSEFVSTQVTVIPVTTPSIPHTRTVSDSVLEAAMAAERGETTELDAAAREHRRSERRWKKQSRPSSVLASASASVASSSIPNPAFCSTSSRFTVDTEATPGVGEYEEAQRALTIEAQTAAAKQQGSSAMFRSSTGRSASPTHGTQARSHSPPPVHHPSTAASFGSGTVNEQQYLEWYYQQQREKERERQKALDKAKGRMNEMMSGEQSVTSAASSAYSTSFSSGGAAAAADGEVPAFRSTFLDVSGRVTARSTSPSSPRSLAASSQHTGVSSSLASSSSVPSSVASRVRPDGVGRAPVRTRGGVGITLNSPSVIRQSASSSVSTGSCAFSSVPRSLALDAVAAGRIPTSPLRARPSRHSASLAAKAGADGGTSQEESKEASTLVPTSRIVPPGPTYYNVDYSVIKQKRSFHLNAKGQWV